MHRTLLAFTCSITLAACAQGGGGEPDAGVTIRVDGGPRVDAAQPQMDGGPRPDGGASLDDAASPPIDAGGDAATSPLCVGVDCSFLDGLCTVGFCTPDTGACATAPAPVGTPCDDGDPCTMGDACAAAGVCDGAAIDCSAADTACGAGTCDPISGACGTTPVADGTSCDTDASDCVAETCQAGSCAAAPAADCSSCSSGGGTVCAGGACGSPPSSLTYGFEAGLPMGWTVGGAAGWVIDSSRFHSGAMAAHSGAIGHSQTSTMTATFTTAVSAEIAFWIYTSSESGYDDLEVRVDGVLRGSWSGTTGWTQASAPLGAAGTHTVEWRYAKDGSVSSGDDRVWIDDVVVRPGAPIEGFESGALPAGWTTSGDAPWRASTTSARSGSYAAESGNIGDNQVTSLHRSVTLSAATTISFWYRVSTESSYDYLEFYLDGVRQDRWSGTVGWAEASYAVSAGAHALEWRYDKDGSVSSGSDAVWIDDVVTGASASGGTICGP